MTFSSAREYVAGLIRRVGGMLVAPTAVRRRLLDGGPGGFSDLVVLLGLQMLTVHIIRLVRSGWFALASGAAAGLPGLTQVALGVLVMPLIMALGGSVLLRIVCPPGRARERALDQASLCVLPSVVISVVMPFIALVDTGGRLSQVRLAGGAGFIWCLALLIHFALQARRELKEVTPPDPEAGAQASRIAGWGVVALMVVVLAFNVVIMVRSLDLIRPVTAGAAAPAFTLEDTTKKEVALQEQQGKVVLISFWATWCTPCLREMPFLQQLQTDLGPRGLRVLAVNVEPPVEVAVERMAAIRKEHPALTYLLAGQLVANRYGVQTLPHLVLVDRQGKVALVRVGAGGEEAIKEKIGALLEGSPPAER